MNKEYLENLKKLEKMADEYYSGQPSATDEEYDTLHKQVLNYEIKNNIKDGYLNKIGSKATFNKDKHLTKMYSIKDCFDITDLNKFLDNYKDKEIYIDHKYDGSSLNLIYEKGLLKKAITRGDGEEGDNVTFNIDYIENIPKAIDFKEDIEIRGEVLIRNSDFFTTVKELYPELSNPRNTASGTLRTLEPEIVKSRKLVFQPYGIGYDYKEFKTHEEIMNTIFKMGFKNLFSNKALVTNDKKQIIEWLENSYKDIQDNIYNIMLDGAVLRVNDLNLNNEFNSKYPKFMLAFKYPYNEKMSKLLNVANQVGRTGIITPVGVIEPTIINGVRVTNVTLHNYKEIKLKDLKIGDSIGVIRSGEVIPKLTSVYKDKRTGDEIEIIPPTKCPICNHELVDEGIIIKCVNDDCKAKLTRKLEHFVSRDNLDIKGIGEKLIEELVSKNIVKNFEDLLNLKYESFIGINNMKEKSIQNTLDSIKKAIDDATKEKFLSSLGIPNFGLSACKLLVNEYPDKNIEEYITLKYEEISCVEGIGNVSSMEYIKYMVNNEQSVKNLASYFNFKTRESKSNKLQNYSFCITGEVAGGRKALENLITENGGVVSSINENTILIANEPSTSSKYKKALELNCKIITEEEFRKMLES